MKKEKNSKALLSEGRQKFEMGDFSRFKSKAKDKSPLEVFWDEFIKLTGPVPDGKKLDVTAIKISENDDKKLRAATNDWAKKSRNHLRGNRPDLAVGMLFLDIGPSTFIAGEFEGTKDGTVIIVKDMYLQ